MTMKYIIISLFVISNAYSTIPATITTDVAVPSTVPKAISDKDSIVINDSTVLAPITEILPPEPTSPATQSTSSVPPSPTTTTVAPPITTTNATTTTTTTVAPPITTTKATTTVVPPITTTKATTTSTTPTTNGTTTVVPNPTTATTLKPTEPTTALPEHHRRFDGPSFVGGIILALGLTAIGFVAFKFYKARTELNYHTL